MSAPGRVWLELHVDDMIVERSPSAAAESVALLRRVAALAEARDARLSFRFRAPLARTGEGRALLAELHGRGHEVGAHAHGRGLAEAADAIRAAGVPLVVATPGLVQVGAAGREALLKQTASLGFRLVTDHGPERAWAYEGLLPREEAGLLVLAPAVRPPDWGLYPPDGPPEPLCLEAARRLRLLEQAALERHQARFFGAALHEHDLCHPGTLTPLTSALEALESLLDARVVPSASLVPSGEWPRPPLVPARPVSDRRVQMARALGLATSLSSRLRMPRRRARWGGLRVPVGRREIIVERLAAQDPIAVLVISHAGREGGRRLGLTPLGLGVPDIADIGLGLLVYDRAGTGASPEAGPLTPGNPNHTDDFRAVLALARSEGLPVIALSWSAGILPVLRAAREGDRPDALIDVEGPADRWSLIPPGGNELSVRDPWDDRRWEGLEPAAMLGALGVPYARLQGELDHVHGAVNEHARRMVEAARAAGLPVHDPGVLAGRVHGHPAAVLDAILWAIEAADQR